ncbi:MAG TPA: hypothetical protein PKJ69_07795, partial [Spirochaetota bacterium]|nr:hypothetical protein [Spirochaetota bacterium]
NIIRVPVATKGNIFYFRLYVMIVVNDAHSVKLAKPFLNSNYSYFYDCCFILYDIFVAPDDTIIKKRLFTH